MSNSLLAQQKDTATAKHVIEKGTKGDIILGKEIQKQQLEKAPQMLEMNQPVKKQSATSNSKKKKSIQKNCKKKS